ncbi:MAG TPA: hypothetical protein PL134_07610 [Smithellaceae bacterium]|jgi:hypothetical protein|nr:MAG: hypothetical protein BWY90_00434 [Deltaproteobacteria bacterium ADurb.BinA014]HNQ18938.1 hypothetical protein [Smithellaceae bacterium]HNV65022.1 hypothetical protein [Smithellaceae bacterium]HOU04091.1 hypothetical protein [Smithellaceae bacterium]HOZ61125.1 hypothetical protein [Smithellaceae bacterium]
MRAFLEYISTWSVLKWVVLVLIAGFIGQFGRMTAEAIVKKLAAHRAKKNKISVGDNPSAVPAEPPDVMSGKTTEETAKNVAKDKLEKKRLKTMAKIAKRQAK